MDNLYTFTIQTEDIDTLRTYSNALEASCAIHQMRDELRSLVKYRGDEAAKLDGLEMAEKIQEMFWELFPEAD